MKVFLMMEKVNERFRTIHLNEVKRMLGLNGTGFRSVITWCRRNQIPILGEGKRRRILESDWEKIQYQKWLCSIKSMFPDQWQSMLKEKGLEDENTSVSQTNEYTPVSKIAKQFLNF